MPIYLHPAIPHPAVIEAYYKDYVEQFPNMLRAAWGFTVETATQGIRLVLSGVFDAYPRPQDSSSAISARGCRSCCGASTWASRATASAQTWFRDTFCEHFWVTTSGFFSDPALLCCIQEMGIDRILFSVDYPFVENAPGTEWLQRIPLCAEDRAKILERQRQAAVEAERLAGAGRVGSPVNCVFGART